MSDKLKGVWVEGRLWENKELLLVEKHLLQKIHDLDNEHGCTAMNAWFAEFLGISKSRVSQIISKFKKQKYLSVKLKYKEKQVVGRVINVLKGGVLLIKGGVLSVNRPLSYTKDPPLAGCEESNIFLLNNTISNLRESKKALTQENEILRLELKKLEAENERLNLELKNKSGAKKEEPKSSAKKVFPSNKPRKAYKAKSNDFPSMSEFDEMPRHEDQEKKKYELELSKFTYPLSWTEYLINQFLEWCAGQDENLKGKFGATHVKALIRKINGHLENYDAKTIGDSIELALVNPKWSTFQPKYITDRQQKEKQDEQKRREQTDSNGKPLQSKQDRFNEDFFGIEHSSDAAPEDSNLQDFEY